jgi:uncharacterized repeat protein (TIGR03806 family)
MRLLDRGRAAACFAFALVLSFESTVRGDDRKAPPADERRIPWTASRMAGTPEPPPPYTIEPAFPRLKFEKPVLIVPAMGTDRLFVGQLGGKVVSFPNDPACAKADLAIDLAARPAGCVALYGLAFHPRYDENRHVYLCYVTRNDIPDGTRVSRFTADRSDPPRIDPASERVLLTFPSGGHNGGCLAFGPDGFLYISTGDAEVPSPPDPRDTGQDVSDLLSSILRIDVDHEEKEKEKEKGRAYRVPPDNPFVNLPGARPEIWAYGFRNPWRMSFDRVGGDLWVGDVGWELWELVDRVERGGNYGWSVVEGRQPVHPEGRRGPTPILPHTHTHPHSEAASITGGYVYRGKRLPDLVGDYVYGDFQSGKVWGLRHDGQKVVGVRVLADTPLQLVSFGEDNAGELYLVDHERSQQVHRLVPNPSAGATREFPRVLSRTGLFASTRDHAPAPGVVPYRINSPLWSDHATAERWLALPGRSRIDVGEKGDWSMPDGAVVARTVSMEMERGVPTSRKRLETQVLHYEGGSWRPYTYVWNNAQTDATLADTEGSSLTLNVRDSDSPGGRREQTYRVHSRAECALCHNPWVEKKTTVFGRQSASPLGLTVAQLNRDGATLNQIERFERLGLFARPLAASLAKLPRLADPYDASADLDRRARSYLHVNCSHCHQFNAGGAATIWLSDDLPLDKMQVIGVRPAQGAFGIADARVIQPGDADGSVLLYRVAKLGGGRMPRVGSNRVDERAVAMLGEWIDRMPRPAGDAPSALRMVEDASALKVLESVPPASDKARARALRQLTSTTRGALALMRRIDRGALPALSRREAVALAAHHSSGEVRDLFERFLPDSERVVRLGDTVDPAVVLALSGDVRRGREIFLNNTAAQCKTCHRLEGAGEPIGPDLAKIGAKYPRPELLRHLLEPSRTIDPKYATFVVELKSGQIHTGLLAERNDREVVLKDAQNRTTRLRASEINQMAPQARSMMPELLLRDLTAQQAADLLDYLGSLK